MTKTTKYLLIALLPLLLFSGKKYLIGPGTVMKWHNIEDSSKNCIPKLQGRNLVGNPVSFPEDFKMDLTLLVIGFKREHQKDINTWIQVYEQKELIKKNIGFFELPIIYEVGMVKRLLINNGMKMGIPDPEQRQRTVTIYMKRQNLFDTLKMHEGIISTLLVDKTGKILWRNDGKASPEKIESLEAVISDYGFQ